MKFLEASDKTVYEIIPPRRRESHKGDNGRVLVVGGGYLYHGAPVLSALATYRSGVDLVYVAVPEPLVSSVRAHSLSLIVIPLPDIKLTVGCVNKIMGSLERRGIVVDSAVVGSGMTKRVKETGLLVYRLNKAGIKVVLDAGALQSGVLNQVGGGGIVLTPHGGEFSRTFGVKLGETLDERAASVKRIAGEFRVTILLKGLTDIISDGENIAVNEVGNPGMTVGGTGDVLSGLVAGLMARGVEPFKAALAAAYINGLAGEYALRRWGLHFTAEDLLVEIPRAMRKFDRIA
ncbi:MAG: NAD(P)H-hydrate dehydratase [Candidatus Geothermarchaeales archaeon]